MDHIIIPPGGIDRVELPQLFTTDTTGVGGIVGAALITIAADCDEVYPEASVTVKLCVPSASPEIVVLAPVPVIAPGLIVQLPAGNPLKTTLPVASPQLGWIIAPGTGAVGTELASVGELCAIM